MVFTREAGPLKIATFNINNINKRLHNLTAWLARAQPDVVCLQELKVEQRAFPASALRHLGYRGVWLGERSWNGVAILARECHPVLTRSLDTNALIQPQSRHAYARLLAQGWTDALRKLHPEGPLWTFWDYQRNRWPLDKGMRLDHFLLSPACDRLVHGAVDRWVRGEENASDHAPAWIVLDR